MMLNIKKTFKGILLLIFLSSILLASCKQECDCIRYFEFNFRIEDASGNDMVFGNQASIIKDSIVVFKYVNDSLTEPVYITSVSTWPEPYLKIEILEEGGLFFIDLDSADRDTLRIELEEDRCLCGQASIVSYNNRLICNHCFMEEPFVLKKP